MVGVEGVPQPEGVSQAAQSQEARMLESVSEKEPLAGHVQQPDRPEETSQARSLTRIEGAPDQSPG